jgi:hypothetical protein
MNFKSRKVIGFFTTMLIYIAIYFITLITSPTLLNIIGVPLVVMIMLNSVTFIGGVILEKWAMSKYFKGD